MKLVRVSDTPYGMFGVLLYGTVPQCVTLENPWRGNTPSISCIPSGQYTCRRVDSPRFGDTFEVADVANRTHILFHKGNLEKDTHGCILLANKFGALAAIPGILESRPAFESFMHILDDADEFELEITAGISDGSSPYNVTA